MLSAKHLLIALPLICLLSSSAHAGVFTDDFTSDPTTDRWRIHGDASLFQWDSSAQQLDVTWDSSQTNSFFYHPLGMVLSKSDDFSLAFDLRFSDIAAGVRPEKPGPFEIAVGFFNSANATNAAFSRGNLQCPNLVEFDYFPAGYNPGYGQIAATVSPIIVSTNRQAASSFTFPLELEPGDWFHFALSFTTSNQTLTTIMTRNGQPAEAIQSVVLSGSFTDFRVDTFSINSYSDSGDRYGSVLAHGQIDNLTVTTPERPRPVLAGDFSDSIWQVQFTSLTNWQYVLERTTNWTEWIPVSEPQLGNGATLNLSDTNQVIGNAAFYRVREERP